MSVQFKIIDNALPAGVFKKLQDEILGFGFPWHYGRRVSPDDSSDTNPYMIGWVHTVSDLGLEAKYSQELYEEISKALFSTLDDIIEIGRIRLICNTKSEEPSITHPHVDFDHAHQTALLYLNDSDGPTILYNEKYNPALGIGSREKYKSIKDRLTVGATIEPQENRLIVFNGLNYHSGTVPVTTARRVVMNVNYKRK
jgi:hypothetical protein